MKPGIGKPTPNWKPAGHQGLLQIKRMVDLIMKVNCQNYALISEVAKEMGMKKTAVMQFVDDNPKLFKLVKVKKGDKVQGLGIREVYETPDQNPVTEEWLDKKKEEWKDRIQVFEKSYYGCHEFYFLDVDNPKSTLREGLWRNTQEKIQTLVDAGTICEKNTCYGGLGDSSNWKGLLLTKEAVVAIKELGWELVYPEKTE